MGMRRERTTVEKSGDPWEAYSASAIGADHIRAKMPNQDNVLTSRLERPGRPNLPVFAVADGHGHIRHFRSDRGSRFAVTAACSVAEKWAAELTATGGPSTAAASQLVSDIVARWRELVAEDLAENPITDFEAVAIVPNDPPEIPYGSTLLIGVLMPQVALLGQVGDGEILLILPDGRELSPGPTDSRLNGTQTTSLCQPDAVSSFRVALVNLVKTPVFGVFASTDGYGNAQAEATWPRSLAADLVRLGSTRGTGWIGGELPTWAATCASSDGSGDDTTVALVLNTSVALSPPASPAEAERPSLFSGPGRTLAYETAPSGELPDWADEAGPAKQRGPKTEAAAVQGPPPAPRPVGSSPPTVPARPGPARPGPGRPPWDSGPPAPAPASPPAVAQAPPQAPPQAWSRPARPVPRVFLLRPQVMLPIIAVLVLAVGGVLFLSMHGSTARRTVPQNGTSTFPSRSPSSGARPTPRNTLTPSSPVSPPGQSQLPEVPARMAKHQGFTLPVPLPSVTAGAAGLPQGISPRVPPLSAFPCHHLRRRA